MELDSLAIALEGVGFDSISLATNGFGLFDIFEFETVAISDERPLSSRLRGRSSKWKRERQIIVSVRMNKLLIDEPTNLAFSQQSVDDDSQPIVVVGRRVFFDTKPISVVMSEAKVNSVIRSKPFRTDT